MIFHFLKTSWGRKFLKESAAVFRDLTEKDYQRLNHLKGRKLLFVAHLLYKFSWILKNEKWERWENKLEFWTHDCLLIYDQSDPLFAAEFYESFSEILACENKIVTDSAGHISITHNPQLIADSMDSFLSRQTKKVA